MGNAEDIIPDLELQMGNFVLKLKQFRAFKGQFRAYRGRCRGKKGQFCG